MTPMCDQTPIHPKEGNYVLANSLTVDDTMAHVINRTVHVINMEVKHDKRSNSYD